MIDNIPDRLNKLPHKQHILEEMGRLGEGWFEYLQQVEMVEKQYNKGVITIDEYAEKFVDLTNTFKKMCGDGIFHVFMNADTTLIS